MTYYIFQICLHRNKLSVELSLDHLSMAASRDRRHNAGNRLSKLLNEEEEDEFYKTTYGGFQELENDVDYQ